jgi:hypothetical protein
LVESDPPQWRNTRYTSCLVEFVAGEPATMTAAEQVAHGLTDVLLSSQILYNLDMTVRALSRLAGSGRTDAGPRLADAITT